MLFINNENLIVNDIAEAQYYIINKITYRKTYINRDMYLFLKYVDMNNCMIENPKFRGIIEELLQKNILIEKERYEKWENFRVVDKKSLKRLFVEITKKCNLSCLHCYNESGLQYKDYMSQEKIKKLIDDAYDMGTIYFDITGGEPFVRKDIIEILKYAVKRGFIVSIYSNMTVINEEQLLFIKNNYIEIITSLDFSEEKKHDALRGREGAFKKTIDALEVAKKIGCNIRINSMINDKAETEINELLHLVKGYTDKYVTNIIIPTGRAKNMYSFDNYNELYKIYAYLNSNSQINEFNAKKAQQMDFSNMIYDYCGIAEKFIFVDYKGKFILCPSLRSEDDESFCFGNITDSSLIDAVSKMREKDVGCKYLKECKVAEKCKGGCRSRAFILHHDINAPDSIMCKIYGILIEELGEKIC